MLLQGIQATSSTLMLSTLFWSSFHDFILIFLRSIRELSQQTRGDSTKGIKHARLRKNSLIFIKFGQAYVAKYMKVIRQLISLRYFISSL